jgi:hypothetical protein
MADIALDWGGDLNLDETGDLAGADGVLELQQRIVRRFLTNPNITDPNGNVTVPADYIFEPTYGGGARQYVDKNITPGLAAHIQTNLQGQVAQEPEAATYPAPVINVDTDTLPNGIIVNAVVALQNGALVPIPNIEVTQ